MGNQSSHMLRLICNSIVSPGDYALDAVWSSWVLIVYLGSHPWGRAMLRTTSLTDVDYQTATAFEAYGRAEVTRRERFEQQPAAARKKQKKKKGEARPPTPEPEPEAEAEAEASEAESTVDESTVVEDGEAPELEEGSDSLEGAGDELSRLEAEMRTAQKRILSAKRKRGPKGGASASTSDSAALIEWWSNALCCKNASVLVSMMAHSKRAAREAANATLRRQAQASISVANNAIIRDISGQNAVDSAQALASSFVTRKPHGANVAVLGLGATRYVGMARTYHGLARRRRTPARSAPRWRGRLG